MFVARKALDARDRDEAWATMTMPERAGGNTYCYAFADGDTALFETTGMTAADLHGHHPLEPRARRHGRRGLPNRVGGISEPPGSDARAVRRPR